MSHRGSRPDTTRRRLLAGLAGLPLIGTIDARAAAYRGLIQRPSAEPGEAAVQAAAELAAPTPPAVDERPQLAIVIDDIGNRPQLGRRAVELPGEVTCSFLPHTPHARELAERAHELGRTAILHVPMESVHGKNLGPGGLTQHMTHAELSRTMRDNLAAVPHVRGVSNHMGSLLTRHPGYMQWVMEAIKAAHHDLFYLDSLTTSRSVAHRLALENALPALKRNFFLDHLRDPESIHEALDKAVERARLKGQAIAIGHPHSETMAVLEAELPRLEARGIRLVPVTELL